MLSEDADLRPTASDILRRLQLCDEMMDQNVYSIFGNCCRRVSITTLRQQHDEQMDAVQKRLLELQSGLEASEAKLTANEDRLHTSDKQLRAAQDQLRECEEKAASTGEALQALVLQHMIIMVCVSSLSPELKLTRRRN